MSVGPLNPRLFKAVMLACAVTVIGATYAVDAMSCIRDGGSGHEGPGDVIAGFQKPTFLAYVKLRHIRSDQKVKQVSVGDNLPDWGVRYYGIPLRYGYPFYRFAVIGEEVVIVDPSTGRVVQVID